MNLTDAQKQQLGRWIDQGLKVADIQKLLVTELGLTMTYMEVRFLIDDLKFAVKDPAPPPTPAPEPEKAPSPQVDDAVPLEEDPPEEVLPPEAPAPAGAGKVTLEVDRIARPGAIVSGTVVFSDGKSATWLLDQFGRLGLQAKEEGYKPPQQDLAQFQRALQDELAKMGF